MLKSVVAVVVSMLMAVGEDELKCG
jgi:hypothetical protein